MIPFDNEWYVVAVSDELRRGKKLAVEFQGKKLALWRRRDGSLGAVDARCPHMGASLAVGRVVDDQLECPYHGFLFNEQGRCTHTPRRPEGAVIPQTLCTRSYVVREHDGWVFLWWGEAQGDAQNEIPEIPYFDDPMAPLVHLWRAREWPVHFTRVVENTFDVLHFNTVHRGTLSWVIKPVISIKVEEAGNELKLLPQADNLEHPVYSKVMYPNLGLLYFGPKAMTMFAAVPLDEKRTRVYLRSSQGFVRLPLMGKFVTWLKLAMDMYALGEDEQAVFSLEPVNSDDASKEALLEYDAQIGAFRRLRRRKLKQLPAAAAKPAQPQESGEDSQRG